MEFARFDLTGLSVANIVVLQPDIAISYTYESFGTFQSCLISITIPNKYLNADNQGLRLMFPSLSGKIDYVLNDTNANSGRVSIEDTVLVSNCRIRAHDNFITEMPIGSSFALDLGIESIDISYAQLNNLTFIDQYLFNGGYHGDPRPPVTFGETTVSFVSVYEEGAFLSATASGITISSFALPKPAKFWTARHLSEEFPIYANDVLP